MWNICQIWEIYQYEKSDKYKIEKRKETIKQQQIEDYINIIRLLELEKASSEIPPKRIYNNEVYNI